MQRKGLNSATIAHDAAIPQQILSDYLAGQREINFSELRPICDALSIRLMRLLEPQYERPLLQYRSTGSRDRSRVAKLENVFLTVAHLLPRSKLIPSPPIDDSQRDFSWLLTMVNRAVEELRPKYPAVEALYQAAGLHVLPISAGDQSFDAFLMRVKDRAVVCVNLSKPTTRIHFSLLHEIAHYLFHQKQEVPIDFLPTGLYDDTISPEVVPEFVANKFAQFYLVPFADAERMANGRDQQGDVAEYLNSHRASDDVLVNAIYDICRIRPGKKPRYQDLKDAVSTAAGSEWGGDQSLRQFLAEQGAALRKLVADNRDEFSDAVWETVASGWEINDAC
jgi:Zn-dependent peptidase ImmA (M78 family)